GWAGGLESPQLCQTAGAGTKNGDSHGHVVLLTHIFHLPWKDSPQRDEKKSLRIMKRGQLKVHDKNRHSQPKQNKPGKNIRDTGIGRYAHLDWRVISLFTARQNQARS